MAEIRCPTCGHIIIHADTPRWPHCCEKCQYLGRYRGEDLWACVRSAYVHLAARYGPEGEYSSDTSYGGKPPEESLPATLEAYRRAVAKGIITPPKPAPTPAPEPFAPGDRVVVKDDADGGDECFCGKHGVRGDMAPGTGGRMVWSCLDGKDFPVPILLRNLRREEPERKFKIGQWIEGKRGEVGRVERYRFGGVVCSGMDARRIGHPYSVFVSWGGGGAKGWWPEEDFHPHAPMLTEAQRRMLPGDEVRVIRVPVEDDGTLSATEQSHAGTAGIVRSIWKTGMSDLPAVTLSGGWHIRLHNLEPVEAEGGGCIS